MRGLFPKWATNLISDSHLIIPVHSPLDQVRSLPVYGDYLWGNSTAHDPDLVRFVPQLGIIESHSFSACHIVVVLCPTEFK